MHMIWAKKKSYLNKLYSQGTFTNTSASNYNQLVTLAVIVTHGIIIARHFAPTLPNTV